MHSPDVYMFSITTGRLHSTDRVGLAAGRGWRAPATGGYCPVEQRSSPGCLSRRAAGVRRLTASLAGRTGVEAGLVLRMNGSATDTA